METKTKGKQRPQAEETLPATVQVETTESEEIKPKVFQMVCPSQRCSEFEKPFTVLLQPDDPQYNSTHPYIKHCEGCNSACLEIGKYNALKKAFKGNEQKMEEMARELTPEEIAADPALMQILQEQGAQQPQELRKTYEVNMEGFDIHQLLKNSINEYIAGSSEIVDQHMKKLVDDAIKSLRPVIIKVKDREYVKMEGRLHKQFEACLFLSQHERQLFIAGPAGSGKTTLAHQVATAMSLPFKHISCSAGLSEAHLLGRMLFDGTYVGSDFVDCYENGGVFLFDEIDAADANTLLVVNSALANGTLSVPNRKGNNTAQRHENFICICAGNTWGAGSFEYHGRNHLDAAFLDRFAVSRVVVDYDNDLEREVCGAHEELYNTFLNIRNNVIKNKLRRVVSTRAFISGARQLAAGRNMKSILDTFFIGWSPEEVKKVTENK